MSDTKTFLKQYGGGSVDLVKEGDIAHVILNNPARRHVEVEVNQETVAWSFRHALSGAMMVDLMEAVEELETWTQGVGLVLRSSDGGAFCSGEHIERVASDCNQTHTAGGDLTTVHHIKGPEPGFRMSRLMGEATNRLRRLPLLSVSLIQVCSVLDVWHHVGERGPDLL